MVTDCCDKNIPSTENVFSLFHFYFKVISKLESTMGFVIAVTSFLGTFVSFSFSSDLSVLSVGFT